MSMENPTAADSGSDASTLSRLESFLTAEDTPEEQDQDTQADAQQANDETATDEQFQVEESPEYQLTDIAKLLGAEESLLDVSDDGNILVKTKIDGQEGTVKFQDLIKSYQLQGHVDRQVREAAEIRKAAEQQAMQLQQQMQVQQNLTGQYGEIKSIESELAQYQNVDWNAWYDQDPVSASKASHQMQALQSNYYVKVNEVRTTEQGLYQQIDQNKKAMLQQEHQALLNKIPDWANQDKQKAIIADIVGELQTRGVSQRTALAIDENHELMLLARDAMLYRQSQTGKDATVKTVRQAPRIIKPGSSQPSNRQAETMKQLHANVRTGKTGSVRDYLLASGKV